MPQPPQETSNFYAAPEISDEGDHVTWHWTVTNRDDQPADHVVMTHRLTPSLPVTHVGKPCDVVGESIKCRWDRLEARETVEGVIEADLPPDLSGSVQISGRVVWQRT